MYRGMDAEDSSNVDYIPVAEYNVVNFFDGLGGVVDAFRTILSVFDE